MLNDLVHPILGLHGLEAYLLVAALCFGESGLFLGFFIPGETAVVLGGVLAYEHHVVLVVMLLVVVVSAIVGDSVGYLVGDLVGERLLATRMLVRHPGVGRARALVRRRGALAVFIGRFVAVLRALVPGIAGVAEVPYRRFLAANAAGGLCWGVLYTMLGYGFGASYEAVVRAAGRASLGVVAAALCAWVGFVVWRRRAEHRRATTGDGPPPPAGDESRLT